MGHKAATREQSQRARATRLLLGSPLRDGLPLSRSPGWAAALARQAVVLLSQPAAAPSVRLTFGVSPCSQSAPVPRFPSVSLCGGRGVTSHVFSHRRSRTTSPGLREGQNQGVPIGTREPLRGPPPAGAGGPCRPGASCPRLCPPPLLPSPHLLSGMAVPSKFRPPHVPPRPALSPSLGSTL